MRRAGLVGLVGRVGLVGLLVGLAASGARAQGSPGDWVDGYASAMVDVLPDVSAAPGRQAVSELRVRLFAERRVDVGRLRLHAAGFVEEMAADRSATGPSWTTTAALVRPTDLYAEWRAARFDLRAGASRLVWGRLDEFQPSDVVNPIDVTRFFLEGRSEARMAVGLVRGRIFLPAGVTVESVLVPVFRRGRFDQLDEPTSPFNVGVTPALVQPLLGPVGFERNEPETSWHNMQGGVRVTGSAGRVDLGASVYRGFEPFASYELRPFPFPTVSPSAAAPAADFAPAPPTLVETFPRFTMVAGDFETTRGPWGIRGEAAYFPEDTRQLQQPLAPVPARTLDAGIGIDRKAGEYRVAANAIVTRRSSRDWAGEAGVAGGETDVLLVGWAERAFARETRSLRLLAAYNPDSDSAFVRGIAAISLRDNVWLELSAGWFTGDGFDMLSRLSHRDFVYGRFKVHF